MKKKKKPASPKIDATLNNVDNSMYLGKNSAFLSHFLVPLIRRLLVIPIQFFPIFQTG